MLSNIGDFDGKKFKSASKGELDLSDDKQKEKDSEKIKEAEKAMKICPGCLKEHLKEQVKEVKFSSVEVSSRRLRVLWVKNSMYRHSSKKFSRNGEKVPPRKKTLEINPDHELTKKLFSLYEKDPNAAVLGDYAQILWGHAVIADGGELGDVARFNKALLTVATGALQ